MATFKQCGCGSTIPKDWPICGQCVEGRNEFYLHETMVGSRAERIGRHHVIRQSVKGHVKPALPLPEPSPEGLALAVIIAVIAGKRSKVTVIPPVDFKRKRDRLNEIRAASVRPAFAKLLEQD